MFKMQFCVSYYYQYVLTTESLELFLSQGIRYLELFEHKIIMIILIFVDAFTHIRP